MIVAHRVTNERFLMKLISHSAPNETKLQAKAELLALQKTSKWAETIDLVDCFTDREGNSYIITKIPKQSLSRHIAEIKDNEEI